MRWAATSVVALVLVGCGSATPATSVTSNHDLEQRYPEVVSVTVDAEPEGTFRFDVTISSPYDSPERYADAWRILAPDGTEIAIRELLHDHASEQPFTRSLQGVTIPPGVTVVTVEGRDLVYGWGGETLEVEIRR